MKNPDTVFFGQGKGPLLLVLDDKGGFGEQIRKALETEDYEVQILRSLEEILPAVQARRPVAVVWDEFFPHRAGIFRLQEFWTHPLLADIPCASFLFEEEGQAARKDFSAEISKPVDSAKLKEDLERLRLSVGKDILNILVVDDEEEVRNTLGRFLVRSGYKVEEAADGMTGVQMALRAPPDLVILDVRMPGMDGIRVAELLRRFPSTMNVPIMILTGTPLEPEEWHRLARKVFSVSRKGDVSFEKFLSFVREVERMKPVL